MRTQTDVCQSVYQRVYKTRFERHKQIRINVVNLMKPCLGHISTQNKKRNPIITNGNTLVLGPILTINQLLITMLIINIMAYLLKNIFCITIFHILNPTQHINLTNYYVVNVVVNDLLIINLCRVLEGFHTSTFSVQPGSFDVTVRSPPPKKIRTFDRFSNFK